MDRGFPGGTMVRNLPANTGDSRDLRLIPGLGSSLGVGNDNPLEYSHLGNSMGKGAWQAQSMELQSIRHN